MVSITKNSVETFYTKFKKKEIKIGLVKKTKIRPLG